MCYTVFVPKGRLLTLRQYKIIYQTFPFVKRFLRLGLFFCAFFGFYRLSIMLTHKNTAPGESKNTRRRCCVLRVDAYSLVSKLSNISSSLSTCSLVKPKCRPMEISLSLVGYHFPVRIAEIHWRRDEDHSCSSPILLTLDKRFWVRSSSNFVM